MKIAMAFAVLAAGTCLLLVSARADTGGGAAAMEVSKDPSLLVRPTLKAGEVSVYGFKLGDTVEKLAKDPAFSLHDIPERPKDGVYSGRDARFYAYDGRIYRIAIGGDLVKQIPSYDSARLQVALGKADESAASRNDDESLLAYYGRHVLYTVGAADNLAVVIEVDLYAP